MGTVEITTDIPGRRERPAGCPSSFLSAGGFGREAGHFRGFPRIGEISVRSKNCAIEQYGKGKDQGREQRLSRWNCENKSGCRCILSCFPVKNLQYFAGKPWMKQ
jgi:hypothetical protein